MQNHAYILTTPPTPKNKHKCTDMSKHAGMHIHQLDNMKKKNENITNSFSCTTHTHAHTNLDNNKPISSNSSN